MIRSAHDRYSYKDNKKVYEEPAKGDLSKSDLLEFLDKVDTIIKPEGKDKESLDMLKVLLKQSLAKYYVNANWDGYGGRCSKDEFFESLNKELSGLNINRNEIIDKLKNGEVVELQTFNYRIEVDDDIIIWD